MSEIRCAWQIRTRLKSNSSSIHSEFIAGVYHGGRKAHRNESDPEGGVRLNTSASKEYGVEYLAGRTDLVAQREMGLYLKKGEYRGRY